MSSDSPAPSDPKAAKRAAEREEKARLAKAKKAERARARAVRTRAALARLEARRAARAAHEATKNGGVGNSLGAASGRTAPGSPERATGEVHLDAHLPAVDKARPVAEAPSGDGEENEQPEGLSWRERRHVGRIAREAEKIALERLNETSAQREQELEARFSARTAESVQAMEVQLEKARTEFSDSLGKAKEAVKKLREQVAEATEGLSWRERRHVGRIAREAEKIALERLNETSAQREQELEARFSARTAESVQAMEVQLEKARTEFSDSLGKAKEAVKELRGQISETDKQRADLEESGAEIKARTASAQDTVRAAIDNAITELTTQADERVKRMNEGVQEATDSAEGLREELSARVDGAMQRVDQSAAELDGRAADLRRTAEQLREQISATGKQQRADLEESGAEIKAQTAAAQDTVRVAIETAIENAITELTTKADERVKRMNEGVQEATDSAEGLREELSARVDGAMQRVDQSAAELDGRAADLRRTTEEVREQISATGKQQRADLEESGAEIKAQTAAAQDTVRVAIETAIENAITELTTKADERVKRMNEGVQEATDSAEGLREELSARVDGAMQRVDQSAAELDGRAAELRRIAEEVHGTIQSAGERGAALEQRIREQSEQAAAALTAEGDRQAERLNAGIAALEARQAELHQLTAVIQEEGGAARGQAVELEEMIGTVSTEMATFVGASQRELDRTLEASRELVASAATDREQEHEHWERVRVQVEGELDRTMTEIREFFLVELAWIRSRVDAIAEAGGVAAPLIPGPEESPLNGLIPSKLITDHSGDVDLNSAGVSELRALDLSMTQARRVIEHRKRIGRFSSVDQIDEVPGLAADQRAAVKRRSTVS